MSLFVPRSSVPLAPLCTLQLGGCARWFVEANHEQSLIDALRWAHTHGLPVAILGGGSNVIVPDNGFDGLVIRVALRGIEHRFEGDRVFVTAAAGEPFDALVARAVDAGWAGLECLSGIPGSVGATPIQNVGAYGQDVSETITTVRVLDRHTLQTRVLTADQCAFGYRDSAFKQNKGPAAGAIVLAVTFALRPGGAPTVRYPELVRALSAQGITTPSLQDVRRTVLHLRRNKSMVIDPEDENHRSVGSFFTNPIVDARQADTVVVRAVSAGMVRSAADVPMFELPDGRVKLAAAWLIEHAGFRKGQRYGSVGISSRHALALVHHGGGTTRELLALADRIREQVRNVFDVNLALEPVVLGK